MRRVARFLPALLLCTYLGVHNGRLALFDGNRPLEVFPYSVGSYSAADQAALKKGIAYRTQEELQRLLEDYLS